MATKYPIDPDAPRCALEGCDCEHTLDGRHTQALRTKAFRTGYVEGRLHERDGIPAPSWARGKMNGEPKGD